MGQTRTEDDVLRSIEDELRQDRQIWAEIEQQLHEIRIEHEPAPPRRGIAWPAALLAMVVVAVAGLSIGWILGDQNAEVAAPVVAAVTYQEGAYTQQREAGPYAAMVAPEVIEITTPSGLENPNVTQQEREQVAQMMERNYPGQGGKGQALYGSLPLERGGKGQAL